MVKAYLLTLCLLIFHQIHCVPKLYVEVFYESLCPDSYEFITTQLHPVFRELAPYIDLKLIPFGKSASLQTNEGDLQFVCQHGPLECKGNKIQSCVLHALDDPIKQVDYVDCFMRKYRNERAGQGQKCAEDAGLDFARIEQCVTSSAGTDLQLTAEERTAEISPKFVPTIVYNKVFNQRLQDASFVDFRHVVCSILRQTYPQACKAPSIIRLD